MKKFHLSIDKPCQENKDNFIKTDNGGFCASCQKEVIDFTKMTDAEIKDYFKIKANRNTCGMFYPEQLKTYHTNHYKRPIWLGVAILSGLLAAIPIDGESQNTVSATAEKTEQTNIIKTPPTIFDSLTLKGQVTYIPDSSGLPGVSVLLKGTNMGTITDINGNFTLKIPADTIDYEIEFSFIGLKTVEIHRSTLVGNTLHVFMDDDTIYESEMICVGGVGYYKPYSLRNWFGVRTLGRKIAGIFRR